MIHANKCYLSESKLYERLIIVTFTFTPSRDKTFEGNYKDSHRSAVI